MTPTYVYKISFHHPFLTLKYVLLLAWTQHGNILMNDFSDCSTLLLYKCVMKDKSGESLDAGKVAVAG